jgi:phage gp45-like
VQVEARGVADEHQHWQPYGFQSAPLDGAIGVRLAPGSNRDDLLVVMVEDRRYRLALVAGEVALSDDLGQKVHLTRDGIVVDAPSIKLGAAAEYGVARQGDNCSPPQGDWALWLQGVATAAYAPSAAPPMPESALCYIASASSKVKAE